MIVIDYINNNGEFTIICWYKKCKFSYFSNIEGDNIIESSNTTYHTTTLIRMDGNVINDFVFHKCDVNRFYS